MQEHKPMIHGFSIDSTSRTSTAHPARAFEQANRLASADEHPGAGKSSYPRANNEHIRNHAGTMPLAAVFGQDI
jgi:hypothetical protein